MSAPSWTIAELEERVATALAGSEAPESGRVRAVPDERAIRYYTTLGLLDRPAMRGRTALYGPRHLAQLVAIKRMQADGRSLAEIQHELPALDDAALAACSGIALAPAPRAATRSSFWKTQPARATPAVAATASPGASAAASAAAAAAGTLRVELDLGHGVRISFAPTRPLTDDDLAALRLAGAPLVAHLVDHDLAT